MSGKYNTAYDIRLSRKPLILFLLPGLFLFTIGLDIVLFHRLLPGFTIDPELKIIFYLVLAILIVSSAVVMTQLLAYLVSPPVMLRADREGISYGTGARYHLRTIPWKYIGDITVLTIQQERSPAGGARADLAIGILGSSGMTALKTTSLGIVHDENGMTLSQFYLSCPSSEAAVTLKGMKKKYSEE